jgi:hypothetical protein
MCTPSLALQPAIPPTFFGIHVNNPTILPNETSAKSSSRSLDAALKGSSSTIVQAPLKLLATVDVRDVA